uniref:Uncharacterized protein n=1 Tax=Picea glauca TaxID=3330 RepID=A0A101LWT2_PICGL|nr:hypothetical protein ABT39_MTgene6240 [Picea glauca]QHR87315.1 hypothetical protein Q903MT_gene1325 [Picea sitchensis]
MSHSLIRKQLVFHVGSLLCGKSDMPSTEVVPGIDTNRVEIDLTRAVPWSGIKPA